MEGQRREKEGNEASERKDNNRRQINSVKDRLVGLGNNLVVAQMEVG